MINHFKIGVKAAQHHIKNLPRSHFRKNLSRNQSQKMSIQPKILGYFLLPHDGTDGFAGLSLKKLLESHGDKFKFPFVNLDRLQLLKSQTGVKRKTINDIDGTGFKENIGWSPTSRFLYQLPDKLEIPCNK